MTLTAQFLFQFEKLLVERRLGDKKLFGGVGDIFFFGDFEDVFNLFQIHKRAFFRNVSVEK